MQNKDWESRYHFYDRWHIKYIGVFTSEFKYQLICQLINNFLQELHKLQFKIDQNQTDNIDETSVSNVAVQKEYLINTIRGLKVTHEYRAIWLDNQEILFNFCNHWEQRINQLFK